ncbi:MAG: hypothetical protein JNK48_07555 [Bryobacterales bacterium]|nr:hypothetical protein [Bryobacterales bacterium]
MNPHTLRQYLLGKLPPTDREALETRAFSDEEFDSLLQEAETDLLDDWARKRLPVEEARIVEARFSLEKRLIAQRMAGPARRSVRAPMLWWIAAAVALAVATVSYVALRPQQAIQPQLPRPVDVASIDLRTPATRGIQAAVYRIPASAARLRFNAPILPGSSDFQLRIESAERGLVAEGPLAESQGKLMREENANLLPDGDYDVLISGRNLGPPELLATYPIRIERR